jgi:hypothetical protein
MPDYTEVKQLTTKYYNKLDAREDNSALAYYIEELLLAELAYAESNGQLGPLPQQTDLLTLLVGYSLEPLLQAIWVYKPTEVLLVLNRAYYNLSGITFAQERVQPWIEELGSLQGGHKTKIRPFDAVTNDTPEEVFRFLLAHVAEDLRHGRHVVVDISGAKKSMVAGAFLFAAYTNSDVSFVDFDEYDEYRRRPKGYTCRIGLLDNPYQRFSLREWERVKQLYERFSFDAAADQLKSIFNSMHGYFDAEQVSAVQNLHSACIIYDAWLNGNYKAAQLASIELEKVCPTFKPPDAVAVLGPDWPHADNDLSGSAAAAALVAEMEQLEAGGFRSDMKRVVAYARDECLKVQNLATLKADYRSALLRAAGLNEFLLKVRVLLLWQKGFVSMVKSAAKARKWLTSEITAHHAELILDLPGNDSSSRLPDTVIIEAGSKQLGKFWTTDVSPQKVRKLRNETTHTVLPIPASIAQAAAQIARENLADFEQHWLDATQTASLPVSLQANLSWNELCHACGVTFLPPLR